MSVTTLVIAVAFASGLGSAIGFIVALYARDFIRQWLASLQAAPAEAASGVEKRKGKRWHPKHPCCNACGTTARPHKARGSCKRCYERTLGRLRRAAAKAKSSSSRR